MADITMCSGEGCPKKDTCYRHTAPQHPMRQSIFAESPQKEDGECDYYWKDEQ